MRFETRVVSVGRGFQTRTDTNDEARSRWSRGQGRREGLVAYSLSVAWPSIITAVGGGACCMLHVCASTVRYGTVLLRTYARLHSIEEGILACNSEARVGTS
jgi:hypothetical protein